MTSRHAELLPAMPVLDHLHRTLETPADDLSAFCGLQHLFGSTATLVHRLTTGTVAPRRVFLLGKPYSTNPRVARLLRHDLGYWVHPDSTDQPAPVENDALMDRRIVTVLDRAAARSGEGRVLLVDDGGRAIRLLHDPRYDAVRHRFACVEQTRCGIRTLADLDLQVPVVNVAESWAKLEHESPLIADSVVAELARKLDGLAAAGLPVGRRALVIGYGAIGAAVAAALRDAGHAVAVHDHDDARLRRAARDGFRTVASLRGGLRRGGIVVGCTGLPVMDVADHDHVADGTLLISASSADVEFRAWHLRRDAECLGDPAHWRADGSPGPDPEGRRWDHPCFALYRVRRGPGRFFLVNGGFPVNFSGAVDPIAPELIQLTRSLLYLGGVQASHTRAPGLHALDHGGQVQIMNRCGRAATTPVAAAA
jgi:S-adenosylhomocysteine hydrolase